MGKSYSYQEVYDNALKYFNGDDLAASVIFKYILQDSDGNYVESGPKDVLERVISEVYRIEKTKFKKPYSKEFLRDKINFNKIIPQGSLLFGIGNKYQYISLSNCVVLDSPYDSYPSIHYTDQQLTQVSKRRCGAGFDISNLRPKGASTSNSSKTSTGIIPFMERYSNSIREVGQSGRRGALIITLDGRHPEVINFINSKKDLTKITGANISLRLYDDFFNAIENDEYYQLKWPVDSDDPSESVKIKARELWDFIIRAAHSMAEPGILFWDTIVREGIGDCYEDLRTLSTNPCSEIPMGRDCCRLILQNVYGYVVNPFTENAYFDYESFYEDAQIMQRIIDDVIDLEIECIERIINKIESDPEPDYIKQIEKDLWEGLKDTCLKGRRTGCGVTGIADALAAMNIKYDSDEGVENVDMIYRTLKFGCYRSSVDMAKELGTFPLWDKNKEKDNVFLNRIKSETVILSEDKILNGSDLYKDMEKVGRRNVALLTTAPAGSISCLSQTSSGIEPVFQLSYKRRKKIYDAKNARVDFVDKTGDSWQEYEVYHPKLKVWMDITGNTDIKKSPWYGATSHDIDWRKRIDIQSRAQSSVCHSISSTINLPEDASVDEVGEIYMEAWRKGLKGVTVYRDGCRDGVLINDNKEEKDEKNKINKTNAPKRPISLPCDIYYISVKGQKYFVFIGLLDNEPYEVFAGRNGIDLPKNIKSGNLVKVKRGKYKLVIDDREIDYIIDFETEEQEALTRMVSASLRHGTDINFIVQQLEKTKGELVGFCKSMARVLKKYIKDGTEVKGDECEKCGGKLIRQEGCILCQSCGWTKCS